MSSAAAEEPAKKRVRINEDNNTVSSTAKPIYSSTNNMILASDPTLLPAIKAITDYYIDKYMSLSKRKYAKETAINKLHDPTYVPKSARLHFKVGVSDKASASDKYEALAASVKTCNETFEKTQKENILKAAELELEVLSKEKKALFCELFYEIASIFFLWKTKSKDINEEAVHKIVQETTSFDSSILKYVFTNDAKVQFYKFYSEIYPTSIAIISSDEFNSISDDILSQIPIPNASTASTIPNYFGPQSQQNSTTTTTAATTTASSTTSTPPSTTTTTETLDTEDVDAEATYNYDNDYDTTDNNTNNKNDHDHDDNDDDVMIVDNPNILLRQDFRQLSTLLKKSFVAPWAKHLADVETRLLHASLTKYATSRIKSKATDKAAAVVANEPSATPQIMSELIKKAVSKETEQLLKKLSKLEQQLSHSNISKPIANNNKKDKKDNSKTKNDTRGEKKTRASTPNKLKNKTVNNSSSKKKPTTSNAKPKSIRKVGDANNDSKRDNKKTSNNKKQMNSKGKKNTMPRTKVNNNRTRNKV